MKNIRFFLPENFHFLVVKFSIYLNRRVFVLSYFPIKCMLCYSLEVPLHVELRAVSREMTTTLPWLLLVGMFLARISTIF